MSKSELRSGRSSFAINSVAFFSVLHPSFRLLLALVILIQIPSAADSKNSKWSQKAKYEPIINQFQISCFRNCRGNTFFLYCFISI